MIPVALVIFLVVLGAALLVYTAGVVFCFVTRCFPHLSFGSANNAPETGADSSDEISDASRRDQIIAAKA